MHAPLVIKYLFFILRKKSTNVNQAFNKRGQNRWNNLEAPGKPLDKLRFKTLLKATLLAKVLPSILALYL